MNYLEATFETLTPMFLGGADQNEPAIRPASIAGAIAFWWRALHAHKATDLKELQRREVQLFGGVSEGRKNQSRVLISCRQVFRPDDVKESFDFGRRYLGYGIVTTSSKRTPIPAGTRFEVKLRIHPVLSKDCDPQKEKAKNEIELAIKALGLFGGLGARIRRGWGALQLLELNGVAQTIENFSAFDEMAKSIIGNAHSKDLRSLELTAFGEGCRVLRGKSLEAEAKIAHENLGLGFMKARSSGQGTEGNDRVVYRDKIKTQVAFAVDHNFSRDHSWYFMNQNNHVPERSAFGLPHSYYGTMGSRSVRPSQKDYDRRASPLWLTVRKIGTGYVPVAILFRNKFLPCELEVTGNNADSQNYDFDTTGIKAIETYLNGDGKHSKAHIDFQDVLK